MTRRTLLVVFGFFAAVLLSGCTDFSDLAPQPDPRPGFQFCKQVPDGPNKGKLIVTVTNFGSRKAAASTTRVDFSSGGSIELATPAILAHSSTDLPPVEMPAACFDPDCGFTITVDVKREIGESNENNNSRSGICIG